MLFRSPRVGGQLQTPGREQCGELVAVKTDPGDKSATVEFAKAYAIAGLTGARRTLALGDGGTVVLTDAFEFSGASQLVEEAFVTWGEVVAHGPTAAIHCGKHTLRLAIEEPAGARFAVESLAEACRVNQREGVLKRLTFIVPPAAQSEARVRMAVE